MFRVLIIDNDVPALNLISEVLTSLEVETRPVSDTRQASVLVQWEKFDSIFLEMLMPEVDGLALTRQIRQSSWNRLTPVVIITRSTEQQSMKLAFEAGATFFFAKPVDKQKLTQLFNSVQGAMLGERRRVQRVPLETEVDCLLGPRKITGRTLNISQDGILFEAEGAPPPGSEIRLLFRLPNLPQTIAPIEAEGVVIRLGSQHRVGVRFTRLSPEDRQRIGSFVLRQSDKA